MSGEYFQLETEIVCDAMLKRDMIMFQVESNHPVIPLGGSTKLVKLIREIIILKLRVFFDTIRALFK